MWKIFVHELDFWQKSSMPEGAKNVIIGDDEDSIIFIAMPKGIEKMKELVDNANKFLDSSNKNIVL